MCIVWSTFDRSLGRAAPLTQHPALATPQEPPRIKDLQVPPSPSLSPPARAPRRLQLPLRLAALRRAKMLRAATRERTQVELRAPAASSSKTGVMPRPSSVSLFRGRSPIDCLYITAPIFPRSTSPRHAVRVIKP